MCAMYSSPMYMWAYVRVNVNTCTPTRWPWGNALPLLPRSTKTGHGVLSGPKRPKPKSRRPPKAIRQKVIGSLTPQSSANVRRSIAPTPKARRLPNAQRPKLNGNCLMRQSSLSTQHNQSQKPNAANSPTPIAQRKLLMPQPSAKKSQQKTKA